MALTFPRTAARPRLGFLGVGWIGRNRLEAIAAAGLAQIAAIADASPEMADAALASAPGAVAMRGLDGLLSCGVDAVVIATPSALHAEQSIRALEAGAAVFCQKPIGRNAAEVERVIASARQADRLFLADFCYRHTAAARALKEVVDSGALGRIFAADLVFHNAYGPDKPWFYDPAQSGGGCVADLGVHLVDMALWILDFPALARVESTLYGKGRKLPPRANICEDYATASLLTEGDTTIRLACSWNLHAGQDAVIGAVFHGTEGSVLLRNRGGSFYDFETLRCRGTASELMVQPPDDWGGRAAADFAGRLAAGSGFDPEAGLYLRSARAIDAIYGR